MEQFICIKIDLALKTYDVWYAMKLNQSKPNQIIDLAIRRIASWWFHLSTVDPVGLTPLKLFNPYLEI